MAVFPVGKLEQIEFCEQHGPVWAAAPATIGLTAAQVAAMVSATTKARLNYNAALAVREQSKGATTVSNASVTAMRGQASDLIRAIKTFAELQATAEGRAAVYGAAEIPPPAAPSPAAAPGKPTAILVTLEPTGAVTLSWEAADAAAGGGAFFSISRKLPGGTAFTTLGGAPGSTTESRRMSFTDATIPASAAAAGVQYIIRGQRGTLTGTPSDAVTVQFGVEGPGGAMGVSGTGATFRVAA